MWSCIVSKGRLVEGVCEGVERRIENKSEKVTTSLKCPFLEKDVSTSSIGVESRKGRRSSTKYLLVKIRNRSV